jgi:hypothetical protein
LEANFSHLGDDLGHRPTGDGWHSGRNRHYVDQCYVGTCFGFCPRATNDVGQANR